MRYVLPYNAVCLYELSDLSYLNAMTPIILSVKSPIFDVDSSANKEYVWLYSDAVSGGAR